MKKKFIPLMLTMVMVVSSFLAGCGNKNAESTTQAVENANPVEVVEESEEKTEEEETIGDMAKITILYTNDVHSYINNMGKDDEGNVFPLLNYASVAALKKDLESQGENVILVDAGDHVQGTAYGAMDEGQTVIDIMNSVGYNVATLGNHEFDYGQFRAFQIMDQADFPYVSCNFQNVPDGSLVLPPYEVIDCGGVKVAFVGISTPDTIYKSTPKYFQNEAGEYIYNFLSGANGDELYNAVQEAVDAAREEADYVIALGHLGVDESSKPYTSKEVIAATEGIDAFIDGHSHTTVDMDAVKDKNGNDVILSQTGSYMNAIGKMTIENGSITTSLITEYDKYDDDIKAMTDAWVANVDGMLGEEIAYLDDTLYINDPDTENRIIRNSETNMGDFIADAYYYYFNEAMEMDCDVALANGGGIRAQLDEGAFSYKSAKDVNPFGNVGCMVKITGQDLLDALEMGARAIGVVDPESGLPAEIGGFQHVAGIRYSIDSSIDSTVAVDENSVWQSGPSGEYKIGNLEVYNRETGEYEPVDFEKEYNVAGINYCLRNQGDGFAMLDDAECVQDYVLEDYLLVAEYAKSFTKGDDGIAHINSKNSPLSQYKGYMLDYENPYGSGRIVIK